MDNSLGHHSCVLCGPEGLVATSTCVSPAYSVGTRAQRSDSGRQTASFTITHLTSMEGCPQPGSSFSPGTSSTTTSCQTTNVALYLPCPSSDALGYSSLHVRVSHQLGCRLPEFVSTDCSRPHGYVDSVPNNHCTQFKSHTNVETLITKV